ncbi:GNAT family N-acetyltransferase [Chengkuizengella marina]|uniref:GNAT family N-acetyltransferase n=1 Tax=Chengkuizengella marina TaxID=2507566 RepID=A0A6N9Q5U3_9BACL|nr:GNAT family protein [Chengkuizengella marina]NBI30202.1 GNAT family N-acetyltransferase [Chengkuizengella marina]
MIREILVSDAEEFLNLNKKLDLETKFMLYEENERTTSIEEQAKMIDSILNSYNSTIFVSQQESNLVGYILIHGGKMNRIKHKANLVIGILNKYCNKGIGRQLFQQTEDWAKTHGLKRLELSVMAHNKSAIALYKKMGFKIEGEQKCSLIVDGQIVDEYIMGKLL